MEYNVYCDESCHLEHDKSSVMALGAVYCPKERTREINDRIRSIKVRNGIPVWRELKWVKVGPSKLQVYRDLIDYFFDDDDLHFRIVVIPDKEKLDHARFGQTHDEWYYKMYFEMLKNILSPTSTYNIYIDIKDTHSFEKSQKLHEVCCNSIFDFSHKIIKRLQPIRSDEVQIMQITDLLVGAVTHYNRLFPDDEQRSEAKKELIELIKARSRYSLKRTTLSKEDKFNILMWEAR